MSLTFLFMLFFYLETIQGCSMFDPLTSIASGKRTYSDTINYSNNFCYGLWFMQQSFTLCPSLYPPTVVQYHLFTVKEDKNSRFMLSVFIKKESISGNYMPTVLLQDGTELIYERFTLLSTLVEGSWNHIHICFNIHTNPISYNIFISNKDNEGYDQMQQGTLDSIDQSYNKIIQVGGTLELINPNDATNQIQLQNFPGQIGNIQVLNYDSNFLNNRVEYLNYLASTQPCAPLNPCSTEITQYFFTGIQALNGKTLFEFKSQYKHTRYSIEGWAIINPLSQDVTFNTVQLLRVSLCSSYQDNSLFGDRIFLWRYLLNRISDQNGIYAATYNINGAVLNTYTTTDDDQWTEMGDFYNNAFYQWHYFQFQHVLDDPSYDTQLSIFFQKDRSTLTHQFANRNQADEIQLFVSVGGDQFMLDNLMNGQIAELKLTYCNTNDVEMAKTCDYTCRICDGPTENDCLDCPLFSFRIFLEIRDGRGKCSCDQGYMNVKGEWKCKQIDTQFSYIEFVELVNEDLTCDYSYFLVKGKTKHFCLPWYVFLFLFSPGTITSIGYYCADCFTKPLTWYLDPVCSFDFIIFDETTNSIYEKQERLSIDYDYYLINEESQTLEFCVGCKGQATTTTNYIQSTLSTSIQIECKQCFKFDGEKCQKQISNCNSCDDEFACLECIDGYTYDTILQLCLQCPQTCPDCSYEDGVSVCQSCPDRYTLVDGECLECGTNCQLCTWSKELVIYVVKCLKCIDINKYYLSLDQINCYENEIPNCQIAVQQELGDISRYLFNSFDIYSETFQYGDVRTQCALCEKGYTNYFHQAKCKNINREEEETIIFDENQPTQITFIKNSINPSISKQKYMSDCTVTNCMWCIIAYISFTEYCQECLPGYYAHTLSGQCFRCPLYLNCQTCQHQYILAKDSWKWDIRGYFHFVMNTPERYHEFIAIAQPTDVTKYEIVCSSCPYGYEFYEQKCITVCPEDCFRCEIINFENICVECIANPQGQVQNSVDNSCFKCPNNCAFCYRQATEEVYAMNPFFNPDSTSFNYYSNICLKSFNFFDFYYDMNLGLYVECEQKPCSIQVVFSLNVYCDSLQYDADLLNVGSDETQIFLFKKKNIKIIELFSSDDTIHFKDVIIQYYSQFEDEYLYQQLANKAVKVVLFKFYLKYNSNKCTIPNNGFLPQKFRQNVYSIRYMYLEIYGDLQYDFEIINSLSLYGFDKILFSNIKFKSNTQSQILTLAFDKGFAVEFDSIIISGEDSKSIQFILYNPLSLVIRNSILKSLNLNQKSSFLSLQYNSTSTSLQISLESIVIESANFKNIVLFYFGDLQLEFQIKIQDFKVQDNVIFNNSKLFKMLVLQQQQNSDIQISQFSFLQSSSQDSQLFDIQGYINVELDTIEITDNDFIDSQIFLLSQFQFTNSIIQSNSFTNSKLLTNNDILFDNSVEVTYKVKYLDLIENQYTSNQTFVELIQLFNTQSVYLENISLQNNELLLNTQNSDVTITAKQANFYITCQVAEVKTLKIVRFVGYPEFAFLNTDSLTIINSQVYLDQKNYLQILHNSKVCVESLISEKQFSSIFIILNAIDITFESINFDMLIVLNKPLINIESTDALLVKRNETITFVNSIFSNITLLQTVVAVKQSIIHILSQQTQEIQFNQVQFLFNHQNNYVNDISSKSSATILIQSPNSYVTLENSYLIQNLVTNSINSVIIIKSYQLLIQSCIFDLNNQYNFLYIEKYFIWGFKNSKIVYYEDFEQTYQIQSKGGSGQFSINYLTINNTQVYQSQAQYGGAFYIETYGDGIINIYNGVFTQCKTTMKPSQILQGGALFIDASFSDLSLNIYNTSFTNISSRTEGGTLYINPSSSQTYLNMTSVMVSESHSLNSGFIKIAVTPSSKLYLSLKEFSFYNSQQGFLDFLGKIESLTESEVLLQSENYIFSLEQGHFNLQESFITSFGYGIFYLNNLLKISIENIQITDVKLMSQQLFEVQLNQLEESSMGIRSVEIKRISIYKENTSQTCYYIDTEALKPECQAYPTYELSFLYYKTNSTYQQQIAQCHLSLIAVQQNTEQTIMHIINTKNEQLIVLENINFYQIACSDCLSILMVSNIIQSSNRQLELSMNKLKMNNNTCGQIGCILILHNSVDETLLELTRNNRLLQEPLQDDVIYKPINYSVTIENSEFYSNFASKFGVLLINRIQTLINLCLFSKNQASEYGGAITFLGDYQEQLGLYNTLISENTAGEGGGLFLTNQIVTDPTLLNLYVSTNNATVQGSNMIQNPYSLTLAVHQGNKLLEKRQIFKSKTSIIDEIIINPYTIIGQSLKVQYLMFPSGQKLIQYSYFDDAQGSYIPYNLSLRIIPLNERGDRMEKLSGSSCNISGRYFDIQSNKPSNELTTNYTNPSSISFNDTSQDYNLDELIIKFDPDLDETYALQLNITCDSIKIPTFSDSPPYLFTGYNKNYTLLVNVQTFQCQRGEQKISSDGTCLQCDSSSDQYSVQAGDICRIKDTATTEAVTSAQMKLRAGYWRAYLSSSSVVYCLNLPINCNGGWNPGDESCYGGHIGALCEQCDIYDTRGEGKFSQSTMYKCGSCNNVGDNTLKIVFISIWTIISVFMSVRGSVDSIESLIKTLRLQRLGIAAVAPTSGYDAVLIKVITNYFQIVGTITTFQLSIPSTINTTFTSVGNPVETMSYSIDCLLITLSDINIIYFRMIWSLIMPLFYLTGFFILYGIAILARVAKRNLSILTTAFIYMYIFMQPTLIGGFVSLLSFRQIGGIYWIQGNVSYVYTTSQHFRWLATFVIPVLLFLGFLIPLFMYISLYQIKDSLNSVESRKKLGYLYNEYRKETYYWEIIKIAQKGLIIAMLTFYQDLIVIKAALIFIIVFVYQLLTKSQKPYQFHKLNEIDDHSTVVCGTSIVLAMTIYSANSSDNIEIVWPFYVLLIIFNGYFCLLLVIEVIDSQLEKNQELIDKIRDKINERYPTLQDKNKYYKMILENSQKRRSRIRMRFRMIKKYLFSKIGGKYTPSSQNTCDKLIDGKNKTPLNTQLSDSVVNYPTSKKIYPERHKVLLSKNNQNYPRNTALVKSWLVINEKREFFDD